MALSPIPSLPKVAPPRRVTDLIWAPMRLFVLQAAMRAGIFEALKDGARTVSQVARQAATDPRATRMMLDEIAALELLKKRGDKYELTGEAKNYLLKSSQLCMGLMLELSNRMQESWAGLAATVKRGKPAMTVDNTATGEEFFQKLVSMIFPWSFASANTLMARLPLNASGDIRILDVAAGSAAWSLPFAVKHKRAQVTVVDLPSVLKVTRDYTKRYGVQNRYEYIAGDIREVSFGTGRYDMVVLGHICHSEGPQWSKRLIAKSAKALKPGGRLVIPDMVPNDQRTGPEFPLLFAINMLLHTHSGDTFTFAQYRDWLKAAGISKSVLLPASEIGCDVVVGTKQAK